MKKHVLLFPLIGILSLVLGFGIYQAQTYDFYDSKGQGYRWSELNQKVLIVNYFAEWCTPCLKEIPELNQLNQWVTKQSDIVFIAVSYDPLDVDEVELLREKYDIQFPVLANVGENFPVTAPQYLPATYIVYNRNVSNPLLGEQTFNSLLDAVQAVQKEISLSTSR
jgi:thiol-disulfide isomerase/thioredoxin